MIERLYLTRNTIFRKRGKILEINVIYHFVALNELVMMFIKNFVRFEILPPKFWGEYPIHPYYMSHTKIHHISQKLLFFENAAKTWI